MKKLTILGSTGSIGTSSLKVIESNPDKYRVVGLAAGRKVDLLLEQIRKFSPLAVAILRDEDAAVLRSRLEGNTKPEVFSGPAGFRQLAAMGEADTVISAMTGAAGLMPTYAAIQAGKDIALANKETMVMAGPLIINHAREKGVSILPIDSEHSAIFQSLQGHPKEDLRQVILTASGGPFREYSRARLRTVTPEQALKHPTWNMGQKISIDSATLMNKGLEVIEAKWLFDLQVEQIGIVIHPQSIIHSMVEYEDGSVIAQLGVPDMITPISYALSYPRHIKTSLPPLKLHEVGVLSFMEPDLDTFRCLALALEAAKAGDSMPAVVNAANEIAVNLFLRSKIRYLQIPELIERTMDAHVPFKLDGIETVIGVDKWARQTAGEIHEHLGD